MFRVLHVTQSLVGGPAAYLDEIAPYQIANLGHSAVRFLLPVDQLSYCAKIPKECVSSFHATRRHPWDVLRFAGSLLKEVREFRPDVIHLHCSLAGAIGRLLYPLYPRPWPRIVYCPHGWSYSIDTAIWQRMMYAAAECALSPLSDRIILISNNELEEARRWGQPQGNLRVVRNGVADLPSDELADLEPAHTGVLNILFVGRLDRQKGFDLLLEALPQIERDDICVHVVGSAFLSKERAPDGSSVNIKYWGWQSRERIAQMYRSMDALIVPSRWEGFGLVAAEALRAGCPVISSRVGGLPELVIHSETGYLFEPNSAEAIAAVLRTLDKSDLMAMRYAARRHYVDNFHSDRLNRELADVYQSLLINDLLMTDVPERA